MQLRSATLQARKCSLFEANVNCVVLKCVEFTVDRFKRSRLLRKISLAKEKIMWAQARLFWKRCLKCARWQASNRFRSKTLCSAIVCATRKEFQSISAVRDDRAADPNDRAADPNDIDRSAVFLTLLFAILAISEKLGN